MNTFSDELRRERASKNISLTDIAKRTRINLKYLEAIEQGNFDILPQTYIRAFLRAYAECIGLSPAEVLKKYEVMVAGTYAVNHNVYTGSGYASGTLPPIESPAKGASAPPVSESTLLQQHRTRTIVAVTTLIVATILLGVYLANYVLTSSSQHAPKEISFQEVVKETEKEKTPPQPTVPAPTDDKTVVSPVQKDSLVLKIISSDSVAFTLARDTLPPRRGYMLKNRIRMWKARDQFIFSVSDAGAVQLFINGKELEPLGMRGVPARRVKITATTPTKEQ